MPDRIVDISGTRDGTYVREPDGATLYWYSPVRWNCPVEGLRAYLRNRAGSSSLSTWEQVRGAEEAAVHSAYHLQPGEYVETP
jgi:hypothetical protein